MESWAVGFSLPFFVGLALIGVQVFSPGSSVLPLWELALVIVGSVRPSTHGFESPTLPAGSLDAVVHSTGSSVDELHPVLPAPAVDAIAELARPGHMFESSAGIHECMRHAQSVSQYMYVGSYLLTQKDAQERQGLVHGKGRNESSCYTLCFRQRYFALGKAGACMCYDQIAKSPQCFNRAKSDCAAFYEVSSDDIADYMLLGLSRASKFNSQQCLQARDGAHIEEWIAMSMGHAAQALVGGTLLPRHGKVRPCIVKHGPTALTGGVSSNQLFYVINQKAASTSTTHMMTYLLQSRSKSSLCFRGEGRKGCERNPSNILYNKVTFSMVSDPISVFVSGFIETVCRLWTFIKALKGRNPGTSVPVALDLNKAGWSNLTCGNASKLFNMFLDDVEHNRQLGSEAFHAWPQAMKLNLDWNMTFIGDVRTYRESFTAMLPRMQIPATTLEVRSNHHGVCRDALSSKLNITAEIKRRLCRMLFVDYVCFGIDLPSECQE